jgi:hypothetical protein
MRGNMTQLNHSLRIVGLLAGLEALGCGAGQARTLKLDGYIASVGDDPSHWRGLAPGNHYALYAGAGACNVASAATLAELEKGSGQPVASTPLGKTLTVIEITDARIRTGADAFAALEVRAENGRVSWLKVPANSQAACLAPVPAGLAEARKLVGQTLVFSPWKSECSEIQAAGKSPQSMLVEAEGDLTFKVDAIAMGPAGARELAAGKSGDRLWASVNDGALKIRADVLPKCFSEAGKSPRPTEPVALMRIPIERCEQSDDEGRPHVECRTTVGIWEGAETDSAIELRAVRRMLGPVHFLAGRLVDGARYARTIVGLSVGTAPDTRRQRIYNELGPAMRAALARDAGSIRVTDPNAPDVTYKISVELGEVSIGELATTEVPQTSRYKVRDDIKPNPDKPAAQQRVDSARDKLSQARQDFQTRKQEFDAEKKKLIDECNAQASKASGWDAVAASTGCAAANALLQPSDSDVTSAQTELNNAESELAKMPDTITVPVMADWSYTKREYSRTANGMLSVTMQAEGSPTPKVSQTPLQYVWRDYEVQGDAQHNVTGHPADHGPIADPEALVSYIAAAASTAIAGRFRVALSDAQVEAARRAMAAAGIEASKPGYETVDAMAYDIVGARLEKPLLRGGTTLAAAKPVPLPADALSLAADQCVLAVAVGIGDAPLSLSLSTDNQSHADLREGGIASIELCKGEVPDKLPGLSLASKTAGEVKWTIFRTRAKAGGS